MRKPYKTLCRNGTLYILHWQTEGRLFGPGWEPIAKFDDTPYNKERVKEITRMMNECETNEEADD